MMLLALSAYRWFIVAQNIWQSFALAFIITLLVIERRSGRRDG